MALEEEMPDDTNQTTQTSKPPDPPPLATTAAEAALRANLAAMQAERDAALQRANASAKLREELVRARIENAAVNAGIISPSLAKYLPIDGASIDDAGAVTGIDTVLQRWVG